MIKTLAQKRLAEIAAVPKTITVTVKVPVADLNDLFEGHKKALVEKILKDKDFLTALGEDLLFAWKEYNEDGDFAEILQNLAPEKYQDALSPEDEDF